MRKVTHALAVFLVFSMALTIFYSCTEAKAKDVVNDVTPVLTESWRTELVNRMQIAGSNEERSRILQSETSRLTNSIIAFLRSRGFDCQIDTLIYRYGSGTAKDVSGGDNKNHDGKFNNQPYAVVKGGPCFKDSMNVFILCFNGTFSLNAKNSSIIGGGSPRFTIGNKKGVNHYVDPATTLSLAEWFNIPFYEGKEWDTKKIISLERARHLYETDSIRYIQVTARVFPGDRFDLSAMTYTPANGDPVRHAPRQ